MKWEHTGVSEPMSYVCRASVDSTDPHLIVQFPAGPECRWVTWKCAPQRDDGRIFARALENRPAR